MVTHHMQVHQNSLPLLRFIKPNHFLERKSQIEGEYDAKQGGERGGGGERGREGGGEREITLAAIILFVGTCLILKTSPVIPFPSLPTISISLSVNLYVYNHNDVV